MRKFLKRMTGIFLCVAMAAGIYGAIPAYAEGTDTGTDIQAQAAQWPTGPAVQAASAIIMDASTGTVLYEKDADTPRYPASITKKRRLLSGDTAGIGKLQSRRNGAFFCDSCI